MKVVILAGEAGTTPRPLTYVVSKCLLPIGGKPLLERTIQYLKSFGGMEVVIWIAYLNKQLMNEMGGGSSLGVKIEYAESDVPMRDRRAAFHFNSWRNFFCDAEGGLTSYANLAVAVGT